MANNDPFSTIMKPARFPRWRLSERLSKNNVA